MKFVLVVFQNNNPNFIMNSEPFKKVLGVIGAILFYLIFSILIGGFENVNPLSLVDGLAFAFSFGFGAEEWIAILLALLLVVVVLYTGYYLSIRLLKKAVVKSNR